MADLASRLRDARRARGLTLADAERKSGIGRKEIARYEAGRTEPRVSTLAVLAQTYGVSLDWLALGVTHDADQWRRRALESECREKALRERVHDALEPPVRKPIDLRRAA